MVVRPQFALCLPTFAAPGAGLFRVPNWPALDARVALDWAVRADRDGFDAIWVPDHTMIGRDHAVLDGWTTLAAVAGATDKARLCLIQQSMLFRHPPQLAKMVATLDHLSGGRVTLFANCGHARAEHVAYGFDWHEAVEDRIARFAEALDLIERLWTEDGPVDHVGRFFSVAGAVAEPRPVQRPRPPLWFAGSEPQLLDLAARQGDGWNTPPISVQDFARRRSALAAALAARGRTIDDLTVTLETQILVRPTIAELRQALRSMVALDPAGSVPAGRPMLDPATDPFLSGASDDLPAELERSFLIGTPDQVRARIDTYRRAGVDGFGLWFMDFPAPDTYEWAAQLIQHWPDEQGVA